MQRETFIIGNREFAANKIAPFAANGILLKLQKIILPVLGEVADNKGNIMEMDVGKAFEVVSSKLDDSVMTDIVLPMFKLSQTACTTENIKLDSPMAIDKVFVDADGLTDLYELIFEVLKYNFAGFFVSAMNRFGGKNGSQEATAMTTAALAK